MLRKLSIFISFCLLISPQLASARTILYLNDGKRLEVGSYWEKGGQICYEKYGGVVCISKESVSKIEGVETGEAAGSGTASKEEQIWSQSATSNELLQAHEAEKGVEAVGSQDKKTVTHKSPQKHLSERASPSKSGVKELPPIIHYQEKNIPQSVTYVIYHGNIKSHIFHHSRCRYYNCKHCTAIFYSREEARRAGYRACKICNP